MLENPIIVRIETSNLAETMNEMQLWLDSMKIPLSRFKLMPTGVEIVFHSKGDAGRFRKQFGARLASPLNRGEDAINRGGCGVLPWLARAHW